MDSVQKERIGTHKRVKTQAIDSVQKKRGKTGLLHRVIHPGIDAQGLPYRKNVLRIRKAAGAAVSGSPFALSADDLPWDGFPPRGELDRRARKAWRC